MAVPFFGGWFPEFDKRFDENSKTINDELEKQGKDPIDWSDPTGKVVDQNDFDRALEKGAKSKEEALDKQIRANRPTINTPFGNQAWTQDAQGNWSLNSGLTGQMGDVAKGLQGQVGSMFGQGVMNGNQARDQAINAAYGQATSRLDPMWGQRESSMKTQLMNQGLDPQSEAYANALGQFGRDRNDAYGSAMNSAIGQGTQAGQAAFDQNMQAQNAPLQRLLQMQNLLQTPNFNQAGNSGGTDYLGAMGMYTNYKTGQDKIAADERAAAYGAGGDLLGSFSDERLKVDVVRHAEEVLPGVPVATWEYRAIPGRKFRGVIAQDLERVAPELVHRHPASGMRMVDYSFAPGLFREVTHGAP
jgi:hypothetical protein